MRKFFVQNYLKYKIVPKSFVDFFVIAEEFFFLSEHQFAQKKCVKNIDPKHFFKKGVKQISAKLVLKIYIKTKFVPKNFQKKFGLNKIL